MGRTKKSAKKSKLSSDAALKSEGRRNNQRYVDDEESSYSSSFESSSEYGDSNSDVESFSDESSSRYGSYAEKGESSTKIVSGAKAPIKSKAKAAVSAEDVTVVRALSRHEHDALNNKQTKYRLFIEGSLENLKSAAGTDAEGNQKPLSIFLGNSTALCKVGADGGAVRCELSVDSAPEDIRARITANKKRPEATLQLMSESPEKLATFKDIVTSVYVSGHSEIPRLEIVLDNLKGCADNMSMSDAKDGPTQSCVIRCEGGHQLKNVRFLHNEFSEDDLRYFNRMAQAGAKDIDLSAKEERSMNGVAMVSVQYDPEARHDVIDLIRRKYKYHPECTDAQRRHIAKTKQMPTDILRIDQNHDNVLFVPKHIYDYYRAEHEKTKSRDRPFSAVAHPFGVATRMVNRASNHFANSAKSAMEIEQKKIWTHPAGINVGAVSSKSSQNSLNKVRQAWLEITVNHIGE